MKKIFGVKRPLKMGVKRPGCETTGNHSDRGSLSRSRPIPMECQNKLELELRDFCLFIGMQFTFCSYVCI